MSTLTQEEQMQIAKTILAQLGGHKFVVMTGAKHILATDHGLRFRIGRNKTRANIVKIDLDLGKDLYMMEFGYVRKYEYFVQERFDDLYADQLGPIFEDYTGMATRL
jgi:hypothetical protein